MMRILASIVLLLALNSAASAQLKKAPPEKLSPRAVQPETQGPAPRAAPTEQSPFVYSPWTKFCGKGGFAQAHEGPPTDPAKQVPPPAGPR